MAGWGRDRTTILRIWRRLVDERERRGRTGRGGGSAAHPKSRGAVRRGGAGGGLASFRPQILGIHVAIFSFWDGRGLVRQLTSAGVLLFNAHVLSKY